ncbi:asparaginase [Rubrobacter indicoceani]|uniref:asparaginase n=1 Tax=Rubrobacter indicoceani TaxID=2051957 RepID=UPI000E5ACE44|nr:asparaginase [Rubrobacter indicoceani]
MGLSKRVAVFSLGGTISSTGDSAAGVTPTLTGEDLVRDVPQISGVAEVSATSFRQMSSGELTLDDLVELAAEIEAAFASGASGAVVTQGTDTIEETGFALDLLLDREEPVVVTGAMRNPTLPGADGPANLLAAVQVAVSGAARGLGALVVINDEVHAARFVRKTHTQSPATFRSEPAGPVGWLAEGRVRIVQRPVGRRHIPVSVEYTARPVALYTASLGDDGRVLPELPGLGYGGLVVEAMGGGHVPEAVADRLELLAAQMPVVLSSRTGSGDVLRKTYGFPGSEIDLIGRGLIPSGTLDGLKARMLLSLLLRAGTGPDEIRSAFCEGFG